MASDPDELGRTATAAGQPLAPVEPPGATLGRYRLERELGAGGMGVVHAAFDPDLERRVALKVLRVSAPSLEAKDRLMREARAMARLSHPNVVTVHEVGTAHGRDFVAMELIHGDNLADWLRSEQRPTAQVIDAFVAAGRGLAAAHAAGIVHRDFKPHNVLRSRDGRIVVTDFGLAREAEGALPVALDTTLPIGTATASTTPGSLSGLTVTGALLGTPAYMAPEQWSRGAVTPATDQFAFCVALWEALTGARPYPGPTLEDLRAQVARGPDALDASKIPRRLRKILRTGLAPDPARRWPSMDALIGHLVRAERRPGVALAIVVGALGSVALVMKMTSAGAPVVTCAAPARDVTTVWSPALTAELISRGHADQARVLDAAMRDWQVTRAAVCHAPVQLQPAQLACLDGVLARFDAVRQGYTRRVEPTADGVLGQLIEPALCKRPPAELPRLALAPTPDVIAAYELYGRSTSATPPRDAEITGLLAKPGLEPCAHVLAALAFDAGSKDRAQARRVMTEAMTAVDQCGDERLRADLLISAAPYAWEMPVIGPKGQAAIRQAQFAATRVKQADVDATLAMLQAGASRFSQRDDAIQFADQALDGFAGRGMTIRAARVAVVRNYLRLARATPEDLAAVTVDIASYRPVLAAAHRADEVAQLDNQAALVRVRLGDVAGGQAALMAQWQRRPHPTAGPARTGEVVDAAGRPVAGAVVAAGDMLGGNSVSAVQPMLGFDDDLRIVTTDARGRFALAGIADHNPIVAQHGALRSDPVELTDRVRLVVRPTRSVRGKVELAGKPHTQLKVSCEIAGDPTGRYRIDAPVAADGSFVIEGASMGALRVTVGRGAADIESERIEYVNLPAARAPVTGLVLTIPSSDRVVDVIVRSQTTTAVDGAQILLLPGKHKLASVNDIIRIQGVGIQANLAQPMIGEAVPQSVIAQVRPGDLVSHVEHVAPGELTVCAIAFTGDLLDPAARRRLQANLDKLAMRCNLLGATATTLVLELPPQRRFD